MLLSTHIKTLVTATALVSSSLLLTGCLLLADRVVNDIGEECEKDSHCPADWAFCGQPSTGSPICLPVASECSPTDYEQCGGYACSVVDELGYCHRFCEDDDECASGFECVNQEFEGSEYRGECLRDPDACSPSDPDACGGYLCEDDGYCASLCTSLTPCASGYYCNDNLDCVRL